MTKSIFVLFYDLIKCKATQCRQCCVYSASLKKYLDNVCFLNTSWRNKWNILTSWASELCPFLTVLKAAGFQFLLSLLRIYCGVSTRKCLVMFRNMLLCVGIQQGRRGSGPSQQPTTEEPWWVLSLSLWDLSVVVISDQSTWTQRCHSHTRLGSQWCTQFITVLLFLTPPLIQV